MGARVKCNYHTIPAPHWQDMASDIIDLAVHAQRLEVHGGSESQRIAALRSLGILDTPPSESFDRITRLAARAVAAPIVLVSLVDESRQWFKSRYGLDLQQTSRDASICSHAVLARRPLVVPDTAADPRFHDNPLVTGAPFVKAYAGIPLYTKLGHCIGTLCAIDHTARAFSDEQVESLQDLAHLLEEGLHTRELAAQTEGVMQFARDRERLFRDTFELAGIGMAHVSLSGRLLRTNARLHQMLGFPAHGLDQYSVVDLTHAADLVRATSAFRELSSGRVDSYVIEKRLRHTDSSYVWCQLSVALKRDADGRPEYVIAVIDDVGARRQAQAEVQEARAALKLEVLAQNEQLVVSNNALREHVKNLLESEIAVRTVEQRLRAIANSVPGVIGYWNAQLRCEFANEMYRDTFGIDPERVIGMRMQDVLGPELFGAAEPHARLALLGQPQHFATTRTTATGAIAHADVRYKPDRDEGGAVRGFFVLVTDTTTMHNVQLALEAANSKLSNDSTTDYLTGLVNRRAFSLRNEEAWGRFKTHGEIYGLILLDLDHFRRINERCGHGMGDEVLRSVGSVLKQQLRSHRDTAARLGGEEFAMLCFGALDEDLLRQVAEHIRSLIDEQSLDCDGRPIKYTASFGLAISHPQDDDWKSLYTRADAALREAKLGGRDCIRYGHIGERSAPHPVR
jgi:diguanylate cyclase